MAENKKGYVHNFKLATLEDFQKFKDEASKESKEEGWVTQVDKTGLKILTKQTKDTPINMLKVVAELSLPCETIYNVLHDPNYRKTWDENMLEGKLIEQLDPFNDVGYYALKSPIFAVSHRDFCNQRSWWTAADRSEYVIFNHSVPHPDCPEKKGFVRGTSILTGYWLRPVKDNHCSMVYMTQTDPGGWIPAWAVNQTLTTLGPRVIDNLGKVSEKYHTWKDKHEPGHFPWNSTEKYFWEKEG